MGEGVNILTILDDLLRVWLDTYSKKLQCVVRYDTDTFKVSFDLIHQRCCRIHVVTKMVGDEVRTAEGHFLCRLTMRNATEVAIRCDGEIL